MTRVAKLLKERVRIVKPAKAIIGAVGTVGGFDRSYTVISEVWAEVKPIAQASRDIAHFAASNRGTQVNSVATHKMKVRRVAVDGLGAAYSTGFSRGFEISGNLQVLKSEYYVIREREGLGSFPTGIGGGSELSDVVGNLYRILSGVDLNSDRELLEIRLMEIEEQGTGAPE